MSKNQGKFSENQTVLPLSQPPPQSPPPHLTLPLLGPGRNLEKLIGEPLDGMDDRLQEILKVCGDLCDISKPIRREDGDFLGSVRAEVRALAAGLPGPERQGQMG